MTIDRNTMEWHFLKLHGSVLRSGPFLMKLYRWNVENHVEAYPDFTENLRNLAIDILHTEEDVDLLRRALQVLAVTGNKKNIPLIEQLNELGNEDLSIDVKTCIFEIEHR